MAALSSSREHVRRQTECLRRDLAVLVSDYLKQEGMFEAAESMRESAMWDMDEYRVCDNVDLGLVLADFVNFYQMRFNRQPMISKRRGIEDGSPPKRKARPQSKTASSSQPGNKAQVLTFEGSQAAAEGKHHPDLVPTARPNNMEGSELHVTMLSIPKHLLQTEESRDLAHFVSRDLVTPGAVAATAGLDDVIGHDEVKRSFEETFVFPLLYPDLFKQSGLKNKTTAILLTGPPGTGKTHLARALASRCFRLQQQQHDRKLLVPAVTFLNLSASSLSSKWRGEGEKLVSTVFQIARHNSPAVVFLDEADAVLGDRGGEGEHEASRRSKAEFLVQLDGLATSSESSVLFLASTNLPWTLDPAIVRRFQNVFHVGLPDKGERKQMLHLKTGLSEPILDQLVEVTDGYTGSDLDRGCTEAKRRLFGKMVEEATTWETRKKGHTQTFSRSQKDPDALKLTSEELVDIFKACGPNLLSDGWKKSYDKWRKRGQKY